MARFALALLVLLSSGCLRARVSSRFAAQGCRLERTCNELVGIDCDSAADGPYLYARADTLEVIATCGGACMSCVGEGTGCCHDCPPPGWTCPTY